MVGYAIRAVPSNSARCVMIASGTDLDAAKPVLLTPVPSAARRMTAAASQHATGTMHLTSVLTVAPPRSVPCAPQPIAPLTLHAAGM